MLMGDSDDDGEDEDEAAEALTGKLELDIMKTITMIKNKDKRIYEEDFQPFEGAASEENSSSESEKEEKNPVRYKDMVRKRALDKEGKEDNDSDESDSEERREYGAGSDAINPSYVESQAHLKSAFKEAVESDDEDDVVTLKVKSKKELVEEEDEFQKYVSDLKAKDSRVNKDGEGVKMVEEFFNAPVKNSDDAFLRNFILKRSWIEKSEDYGSDDVEEDEDFEDAADTFEAKYNFRFEEEGAEKIESHPRTLETSVRRKEKARKRQRLEKRDRKNSEKIKRQEELRRLKNLKKQELESRLQKSFKAAGVKNRKQKTITCDDLDAEFDPEEWDKKMNEMFDDDYYNESDEEFGTKDEGEPKAVKMKAVIQKSEDQQSENEQVVEAEDDHALDELHDLDYEGTIDGGRIKTRFRYRQVEPESYGLSAEEILLAEDKLLQSFVTIKNMAPYREEVWHAGTRHRLKFRKALQEQLEKRAGITQLKEKIKKKERKEKKIEEFEEREEIRKSKTQAEEEEPSDKKKRKRSKKKKEEIAEEITEEITEGTNVEVPETNEEITKKKRKRSKKKKAE